MKITFIKWLVIILSVVSFFGSMATYFYVYGFPGSRINDPYAIYKQGEIASTPENRRNAFNRSLRMYQELEESYHPQNSTGKLYYNLGNNYYQLSEYPMALLYYYKASLLRPTDRRVTDGITSALQKLGLPYLKEDLFWHWFSLPERLQIFSTSFLIFFLLASAAIWLKKKWLENLSYFSLIICFVFGLTFLYTFFFSPLEGVVIKGSAFYKHPGKQFAKISDKPVPAGLKVRVIGFSQNKDWVKIVNSDGVIGYIRNESIKMI